MKLSAFCIVPQRSALSHFLIPICRLFLDILDYWLSYQLSTVSCPFLNHCFMPRSLEGSACVPSVPTWYVATWMHRGPQTKCQLLSTSVVPESSSSFSHAYLDLPLHGLESWTSSSTPYHAHSIFYIFSNPFFFFIFKVTYFFQSTINLLPICLLLAFKHIFVSFKTSLLPLVSSNSLFILQQESSLGNQIW